MTKARRLPVFARPDGLPAVIVHGGSAVRGYRDVLSSLDTALTTRADGFELDVRRTNDGELVVHHDEAIADRPLRQMSYCEASRQAHAVGYSLPRLSDVIDQARGRLRLDVEFKEAGYEREILTALRSGGLGTGDFVATSFDPSALTALHAHGCRATGLLVWDVTGAAALAMCQRSGAAFLGVDFAILTDDMLAKAREADVVLVAWTVNSTVDLARLMKHPGIAAVITDEPMLAIELRRSEVGN